MRIIVTHNAPDWDAIGSVWILRKYLPGWHDAHVKFVPAGQRLEGCVGHNADDNNDPVEKIGEDIIIHVDTGLGPLDHHQTSDKTQSGAGRSWEYIKKLSKQNKVALGEGERGHHKIEAVNRVVKFIVETDHFREIYWPDPANDRYEFTILGVLEGLKHLRPNEDDYYVEIGITILDSLTHQFANRIWAEEEMENGIKFESKWGNAIGFETINDDVLKLSQKKGYMITLRKDPRKGYVRIKAHPYDKEFDSDKDEIDLEPLYKELMARDSKATWFLHVSHKMLLNGTPKNPKMVPTKLSLEQIIEIIKNIK